MDTNPAALTPSIANEAPTCVDANDHDMLYTDHATLFQTSLEAVRKSLCGDEFLAAFVSAVEIKQSATLNSIYKNLLFEHLKKLNRSLQVLNKEIMHHLLISACCSAMDQHNNWVVKYQVPNRFEVITHDQIIKFNRIFRYLIEKIKLNDKSVTAEEIFFQINECRYELNSIFQEMRRMHNKKIAQPESNVFASISPHSSLTTDTFSLFTRETK